LPAETRIQNLDISIIIDTILMKSAEKILAQMQRNPKGVSFKDLCKVCDQYCGKPRLSGTSHRVYQTPWLGDPRVNIQSAKGKAKPYQVRQVLLAIARLEEGNEYRD
jgi:hypothetical protein